MVVDDEPRLLHMMEMILETQNYRVGMEMNGNEALASISMEIPDLIILDLKMPGMDGYTVCQRVREFSQVPIIVVTATGNDETKVKLLDAGADDYITKPFSADEFTARVKSVLRRTKLWEERPEPIFQLGDLVVDFARHRVMIREEEIMLTAVEYTLLSYLARNAGRILTPDQILQSVWGDEYIGESHILRVSMTRLRRKLGDDGRHSQYIRTRTGIGYMMEKRIESN